MPTDDPILRVIDSEFALHRGRSQHRPTYDTGRKGSDGVGADVEQSSPQDDGLGAATNELVAVWTADGIVVTFEPKA